jgi:hypothetical protein
MNSIKNEWEHQWVNNVINNNRSFSNYVNSYSFSSKIGLQVRPTFSHQLLSTSWKDLLAFGTGVNDVGLAFDNAFLHPINTMMNIGKGLANGLMNTGYWVQELYSSPKKFFPEFGTGLKMDLKTDWNTTKKYWDILSVGDPKSYELEGKLFTYMLMGGLTSYAGGVLLDGVEEMNLTGRGLSKITNNRSAFFSRQKINIPRGLNSGLSKEKITNYLSNVKNISREQLIKDLKSIGLKLYGESPDGLFKTFEDKSQTLRIKLHPPDSSTDYSHMHIYDKSGKSLDWKLNEVPDDSPSAHIEINPIKKELEWILK